MTQIKNYQQNKKQAIDANSIVYGKMPPQSKELEEVVLGAILLVKDAFDTVSEILKVESFYSDAHQRIFKSMVLLAGKNMPIDLLTVVQQLQAQGDLELVGGMYYVSKLTNSVVSSANIETHANIIQQKFILRELIRISAEIMARAYDQEMDVFDTQSFADISISTLVTSGENKVIESLSVSIVNSLRRMEELRKMDSQMTGTPAGFTELDKITHGWQNTDLIILAARPSVGKTAMALNFALSAASYYTQTKGKNKVKSVAFFSLEMSIGQLVERAISSESGIFLQKIKTGDLTDAEMLHINHISEQIVNNIPLFIDDSASINILQLRAKCRRLKAKNNLGMIVIDYLQLMSGLNEKNGNREQEISKISRDLKGLAKELEIPIIALSQLSRKVEERKEGAKIPQLSDLRESGAIEQDADMVMFLYRPEYYGINSNEHGESTNGETHIKIAKHRNGDLGDIKLSSKLSIQKFYDFDGNSNNDSLKRVEKTYTPKRNFYESNKESEAAPF